MVQTQLQILLWLMIVVFRMVIKKSQQAQALTVLPRCRIVTITMVNMDKLPPHQLRIIITRKILRLIQTLIKRIAKHQQTVIAKHAKMLIKQIVKPQHLVLY